MSAKSTPDWKQRLKTMRTTDANLEAVCSAYLSMSEEEKILAEEFVFFRNASESEWNFRRWNMETYSGMKQFSDEAFERVVSNAPWEWCVSMLGLWCSEFLLGHDEETFRKRSTRIALKTVSSRGRAREASEILYWGNAPDASDILCEYILEELRGDGNPSPESEIVRAAAYGAITRKGGYRPELFEAVFGAELSRTAETPLSGYSPYAELVARRSFGFIEDTPITENLRERCTGVVLSVSERLEKEKRGAGRAYLATVATVACTDVVHMATVMRMYDKLDPEWKLFAKEAEETSKSVTARSDTVRRNVDFLFERLPSIAGKLPEKVSAKIHSIINPEYCGARVLELLSEGDGKGAAEAASAMKLGERKELFASIDVQSTGTERVLDIWKALFPRTPKLDVTGAKETDLKVLKVLTRALILIVEDAENIEETAEKILKIASGLPECDERRIIEKAVLNAAAGAEQVDHIDGVVL